MQVILYEDMPNLGNTGDVVNVRDGYARNYLIPRGIAVVANPKNIHMLEHQKRVASAKQAKMKEKAQKLALNLAALSITIAREAGEEDKLFGSVTAMDISSVLAHEGYTIDKRHIKLAEPIRKIGVYDVSVRLHPEVDATVKVWIVKK